ncbi:type I-E CRISPR-associated protein Cse2/CasB [Streptomyces kanasensis]|uniref:type I-E CRISPR-associated protein Cse2/CasB n=1 Tax=Streptomyces kanasensis TaxID=936756 RepID=UPI0036F5DDC4
MTSTASATPPDSTSPSGPVLPQQRAARGERREETFVARITTLCADPGARTALRSGLRKDLDAVPRMHKLVAPWLPQDHTPEDVQRAYYAVAAMIAAQPRFAFTAAREPDAAGDSDTATAGADTAGDPAAAVPATDTRARRSGSSLGAAFAAAVGTGRDSQMREASAEARLNLLTRQSLPGLHRHLPAAVAYLRSLDVDVDFAQLLSDLAHWQRHSGRIARRWLQDYYRLRAQAERAKAEQRDAEAIADTSAAE